MIRSQRTPVPKSSQSGVAVSPVGVYVTAGEIESRRRVLRPLQKRGGILSFKQGDDQGFVTSTIPRRSIVQLQSRGQLYSPHRVFAAVNPTRTGGRRD
jgi:hypothetical protein